MAWQYSSEKCFKNIVNTPGHYTRTVQLPLAMEQEVDRCPHGAGNAFDWLVSWTQAISLAKRIAGITMTIGYDPSGPYTPADPCQNLTGTYRTDGRLMHGAGGHKWTDCFRHRPIHSTACTPSPCASHQDCRNLLTLYGQRSIAFYAKTPITNVSLSLAHATQNGVTPVTTDAGTVAIRM